MLRKTICALSIFAATAICAPANANVVYNLTFTPYGSSNPVGTGTLTLNFSSLAQAFNQNTALDSILVSIVTTNLDGHGAYLVTPANLLSGSQFQTGDHGQIYTLSAEESGCGLQSILFLDLFTNSWQLHNGAANGATADQGAFTISEPLLVQGGNDSSTPLPASLSLFAAGAAILGLLGRLKKRK